MGLLDELIAKGVDTDDAIKRLMGEVEIYERMIKKVVASVSKYEVLKYIEENDIENATMNAHSLKGVMGNLSINPLYEGYTKIVNLLRENQVQQAKDMLIDLLPIQEDILNVIKKYS